MASTGGAGAGAAANLNSNTFDWGTINTMDELKEHMILFLEGKHKENPWHGGPVDSETVPLLGNLIMINRLGMVTFEGQPGMRAKMGNTLSIQHGYIIGILTKEDYPVSSLVEHFRADSELFTILYDFKEKKTNLLHTPTSGLIGSNTRYPLAKEVDTKTGSITIDSMGITTIKDEVGPIAMDGLSAGSETLTEYLVENGVYICCVNLTEPDADESSTKGKDLETKIINILTAIRTETGKTEGGSRRIPKRKKERLHRTNKRKRSNNRRKYTLRRKRA
jgi:hypothetical protein